MDIADSQAILDARVNEALAQIANRWQGPENPYRFAVAVFYEIGGLYWVDELEAWTQRNSRIERLPQSGYRSIYSEVSPIAGVIIRIFGVSPTIRVNQSLIGTDKFGHFLSQGFKYYRRLRISNDTAEVLRLGLRLEGQLFGYMTTGVYSNADLVANYEGMRFYQSLSSPINGKNGKPAIIGWRDGKPFVQRPFTWADHINDYWDEALNPSRMTNTMQEYIYSRLLNLCPQYHRAPERFVSGQEQQLRQRYAHLGLDDWRRNRLDRVCGGG